MAFPTKNIHIKNTSFKQVFKTFQFINLGIFGTIILMFLMMRIGACGYIPDLEEIKNPKSLLATNIYSEDYELLGSYYIQNRTEVRYEELSPWLVKALVATEDKRFYEHSGIDFKGTVRAFAKLGRDGGGSTLSQQTAKNLFFDADRSSKIKRLFQKIKEQYLAVQLERNFSKEEIVALYFNTVFYNYNAYGIKTAAHTYFNKNQKDLTVEEAALLVGMLKGPSMYNPRLKADAATRRRNTVLDLMADQTVITQGQADSIKKIPIKLNYKSNSTDAGLATYFRDQISIDLKKWISEHPKPDGTKYNLYTDGLQIHTTINSKMQQYAEDAVQQHLKQMQKQFFKEWHGKDPWKTGERANPTLLEKLVKRTALYKQLVEDGLNKRQIEREMELKRPMTIFAYGGDRDTLLSIYDSLRYYKQILQTGFVVLDPKTGFVKAWVGGPDFTYFQLDHVRATRRQVGSTMKPLLYGAAMDMGMTPQSTVPYDCPNIASNPNWCPAGTGTWPIGTEVTLSEGLKYSDNMITSQVMKIVGPQALINMARKLGINSEMDAVPSLALGTCDVSVIDMAGAYTAFANRGVYSKPMYITRITDRNGKVLDEFTPTKKNELSERTAFCVINMMRGVVTGGTAKRLQSQYGLRNVIAGKTGTTQSNSDAWFVGVTPNLLGVVWVGCDEPSIHFATTGAGQGASAALPIWALFFKKVYADRSLKIRPSDSFDAPDGFTTDTTGALIPVLVDSLSSDDAIAP